MRTSGVLTGSTFRYKASRAVTHCSLGCVCATLSLCFCVDPGVAPGLCWVSAFLGVGDGFASPSPLLAFASAVVWPRGRRLLSSRPSEEELLRPRFNVTAAVVLRPLSPSLVFRVAGLYFGAPAFPLLLQCEFVSRRNGVGPLVPCLLIFSSCSPPNKPSGSSAIIAPPSPPWLLLAGLESPPCSRVWWLGPALCCIFRVLGRRIWRLANGCKG